MSTISFQLVRWPWACVCFPCGSREAEKLHTLVLLHSRRIVGFLGTRGGETAFQQTKLLTFNNGNVLSVSDMRSVVITSLSIGPQPAQKLLSLPAPVIKGPLITLVRPPSTPCKRKLGASVSLLSVCLSVSHIYTVAPLERLCFYLKV